MNKRLMRDEPLSGLEWWWITITDKLLRRKVDPDLQAAAIKRGIRQSDIELVRACYGVQEVNYRLRLGSERMYPREQA